jgi:hypothetical protein
MQVTEKLKPVPSSLRPLSRRHWGSCDVRPVGKGRDRASVATRRSVQANTVSEGRRHVWPRQA